MVALKRSSPRSSTSVGAGIFALLLLNLLMFQLGRNFGSLEFPYGSLELSSISSLQFTNNAPQDPLAPRQDQAVALPSIRVNDQSVNRQEYGTKYGGKGDMKHLGGFTEIDHHGLSPFVWRLMMREYGVKSIIDVGCGRGISTSWFILNGMDALCVEGSHDAYENSMLPDKANQMVEHDFSRGPWWPAKTYDAVWCVEFLEHVGRNFHENYLPVFRKSAIIFASHSIWGGWHHVEVHKDEWWINKFELYGFKYMPDITKQIRDTAMKEANTGPETVNGKKPNPQNLYNMLVFFNPAVGALPQHAHLFSEPGCFESRIDGVLKTKDCGTGVGADKETPLPPEYKGLPLLEDNQVRWEQHVRQHVAATKPAE